MSVPGDPRPGDTRPGDDELGERLRNALENVSMRGEAALPELLELYDTAMVFHDPLAVLSGREAFEAAMRKLLTRSKQLRISVHDSIQRDERVVVTWTLYMTLQRGPELVIEGATHARTREGRIIYQRDYWDLLGSVMDCVPMASTLYRTLTARLV
mgnify:CR=1 FL=1